MAHGEYHTYREYRRWELKQGVRQAIKQTRPRPFWVTLLFSLIVAVSGWVFSWISGLFGATQMTDAIASIMSGSADPEEMGEILLRWLTYNAGAIAAITAISSVIDVISSLWQSVLQAGYSGYCLSLARNERPPLGRIFCSFPCFGRILLARVLVWVFTFLWMLAFTAGLLIVVIIAALLMATEALVALGVILMLAGIVAYLVCTVWVSLRYSMVDYLVIDQGLSGLDAVTESKRMMKGNKRRLFMLYLSFIGWYLLEALIAVVGVIIIVVVAVATFGYDLGAGVAYGYGGGLEHIGMATLGGAIAIILVALVMIVAVWIIGVWLEAYVEGSKAALYDFIRGGAPQGQPAAGGPVPGGDIPLPDTSGTPESGNYTYIYRGDAPENRQPEPPAPPAQPEEPAAPAWPEEPTQPAQPEEPAAPAQPANPIDAFPPTQLASPVTPEEEPAPGDDQAGPEEEEDGGEPQDPPRPGSGPTYPEY